MNINQSRNALGTLLTAALALSAILTSPGPAAAQYAVSGAPGVANVSAVEGSVLIVRGDSGAQVGATLNAPLLPGDYISTAGGSRAEVQFDGISMLRLAQDTQVRFVSLNPGSREMQLAAGTAELAELRGTDGRPQIDTPSVTVRPNRTGDYRVSVLSNGQTLVTVRSGAATVNTGNGAQTVTAGSTLLAYGAYANPAISLRGAIAYDAFDAFNADRDRAVVVAYNSDPYLAPALSGYANFSNYGQWYNVPGYGQSWAPYNQGNNWTPYSNGQWVWEPGYGYTWVGNEPWGYAPYHYGNWYYANNYNRWMWQPPAYSYQNNASALASAWLPALVAFFLTGGNTMNPYGSGNVGWVPLAPGEQYVPWYSGFGANAAFPSTRVSNVTNVYNIYNVYRNFRYIRVVRVVTVDRFRNGQFSTPILMRPADLRRIVIIRGAVPIVPTRALLGTRVTREVVISTRFRDPRFVARTPVITTRTMSFDRQQAAIKTVVSTKPAVVTLPSRATTVVHPVYRAPVVNETIHPPAMIIKPNLATPRPAATRVLRTQHTAAPQRTEPPVQHIVPRATHSAAPLRTEPPVERVVPPKPRVVPPTPRVIPPTPRVIPPTPRVVPTERPTPHFAATPAQEHAAPPAQQRAEPLQPPRAAQTAPPRNTPKPEATKNPKEKATSPPPPR